MSPGIPGAGIGGLFYLAASAALAMRHAWRRMRRRSVADESRSVALLAAVAAGIALGVWLAGWLVGAVLSPDLLVASRVGGGRTAILSGNLHLQNAVRVAALIAGVGTLVVVLLSVEVARLWQRWVGVFLLVAASSLGAQGTLIARADSAFAAEDRVLARRLYQEAVRVNPEESRAIFRLAQLETAPAEALTLYQRYVTLEPQDAWGHMAYGDQLARTGRFSEALASYDRAAALAPNEPDVANGRARVQQLAARHAPTLEPLVAYQHDSDGNTTTRAGLAGGVTLSSGMHAGAAFSRGSVRDGAQSVAFSEAMLRLAARGSSALRFDAEGGLSGFAASPGAAAWTAPRADVRVRWRAPKAPSLELRAQHLPLATAPVLVANRVTRSDARATLELPVGPIRIRGNARAAALRAVGEPTNRRVDGGAALVLPLGGSEMSVRYHNIAYARPSAAGYFAPRLAQTVEGGTYLELGEDARLSLSADLGGGLQRMARYVVSQPAPQDPQGPPRPPGPPGAPVAPSTPVGTISEEALGAWKPALRAWTYAAFTFAPGRALWLELEAYDAPFAPLGVSAAPSWRFLSLSSGLRWSLR